MTALYRGGSDLLIVLKGRRQSRNLKESPQILESWQLLRKHIAALHRFARGEVHVTHMQTEVRPQATALWPLPSTLGPGPGPPRTAERASGRHPAFPPPVVARPMACVSSDFPSPNTPVGNLCNVSPKKTLQNGTKQDVTVCV